MMETSQDAPLDAARLCALVAEAVASGALAHPDRRARLLATLTLQDSEVLAGAWALVRARARSQPSLLIGLDLIQQARSTEVALHRLLGSIDFPATRETIRRAALAGGHSVLAERVTALPEAIFDRPADVTSALRHGAKH